MAQYIPGQDCHTCGRCSVSTSPFPYNVDFSTIGNQSSFEGNSNEYKFFASPCGGASGLTVQNVSGYTPGCNSSMVACYCSIDFHPVAGCVGIGFVESIIWDIPDQNTVVQYSNDTVRCQLNSGENWDLTIVYVCADRVLLPEGFREASNGDPFRQLYCGGDAEADDFCKRCLIWETPDACLPPGTINVTSTQILANQVLNVSFAFTSIPQLGANAFFFPVVDGVEYRTLKFTSSPAMVDFSSIVNGQHNIGIRLVSLENSNFNESTADSQTFSVTISGSTATPAPITTTFSTATPTSTSQSQTTVLGPTSKPSVSDSVSFVVQVSTILVALFIICLLVL